ncbi:hypothetical protein KY334_06365 [Candidatus Woesearchaeota archaeon]|nr:hypothetical protein [Candidatus Woesearchaeota archaeon]
MNIIGSDESLKGDSFGGITVAAVRADPEISKVLESMGVKDSKKLTDHKIMILAQKIKEVAKVYFINLYPEQYNRRVLAVGLTNLLNDLHTECINALRSGFDKVIVDEYPGCKIKNATPVQKAEDQYVEVAAASIIARYEAIKQIKELSILAGFPLPKGSTHVTEALIKLRNLKKPFDKFTKISFKNVKFIMETRSP